MIIWGWGKVTKKIIGAVFERTCNYCNTDEVLEFMCCKNMVYVIFYSYNTL